MLIWLQFDECDIEATSVPLHGELPKPGSEILFRGKHYAVSAIPTAWTCQGGELIPVLHLIPKSDDATK